jgi:hypothetical protein
MKESSLQHRILAEFGHGERRLFRMNVGLAWIGTAKKFTQRAIVSVGPGDVVIRSARAFKAGMVGMSDLIGWQTVEITPEMVGRKIAVYTAIECKGKRTRVTAQQLAFLELVRDAGGLAGLARSEDDVRSILADER